MLEVVRDTYITEDVTMYTFSDNSQIMLGEAPNHAHRTYYVVGKDKTITKEQSDALLKYNGIVVIE
jgi:hypothetical protein